MANKIKVFMSYARQDENFVQNHIVQPLRLANFEVWFDRTNIRSGHSWEQEILQAIEGCQVLVVAISQRAINSKWVQREYKHALELGKLVVPCRLEVIPLPKALAKLQWVELYDQNLWQKGISKLKSDILRACSQPVEARVDATMKDLGFKGGPVNFVALQAARYIDNRREAQMNRLAPKPEYIELYDAGLRAKAAGDLDAAASHWEYLLNQVPDFMDGQLKQEFTQLMVQVKPLRIERLRKQADDAADAGEWEDEIAALRELLQLNAAPADAKMRIEIAQVNQKNQLLYESAQRLINEGSLEAARTALQQLYQAAPFFGDPHGVAKQLGMSAGGVYYQREQSLENRKLTISEQLEAAKAEKAQLDAKRRPLDQQYSALFHARSQTASGRGGCVGWLMVIAILMLLLWGAVTLLAHFTSNPGNAAAAATHFPLALAVLFIAFIGKQLWAYFRLKSLDVELQITGQLREQQLVLVRPVEARIEALKGENKQVKQEAANIKNAARGGFKPAWRRVIRL